MTPHDKRAAFIGLSISLAAGSIGMHPQTLREYERKGLVTPHRTPGGARRYRDEEMQRLRRIQQLTEQGMSLAAVEYVLDLEDELARTRAQLRATEERLLELERQSGRSPRPVKRGSSGADLPVRRSVSLEIVHVPRPRRSPRWRNFES